MDRRAASGSDGASPYGTAIENENDDDDDDEDDCS
jgi:hypothetical protein